MHKNPHAGLRILSLNYEFPPIGGGGGNAHQNILRQYTQFPDFDVTLLTTSIEADVSIDHYADNVRIIFLPQKKRDLLYWRRSEVLSYLFKHYGFLRDHLQKYTYDLCHVFFGFPSGPLAWWFRNKFPSIISVRGSDVPGYNKRFSQDYMLLAPLLNRIYHQAQAVVANSRGLKELFETHYPDLQARVIPNGVDPEFFQPQEHQNERLQLVTIARFIPRKGLDVLIKACGLLLRMGYEFDCHFIGEGPEENRLRQLTREEGIGEKIRFHGMMERSQLAAFLPTCDAFVLPSHAEGMPNAALEAMACGLPLILTDTGGSHELIQENGLIIEKNNVQALANALRILFDDPSRGIRWGQQSRARVQHFSWLQVAQQYRNLYYKCVQFQNNNS